MEQEKKLAVLIDGENIAPKYVETILKEANAIGNVIYKRVYGNWTSNDLKSWKNIILDNALQPIQQFNNVSGKGASDSALIIDAMDLLYKQHLNGFCIVSSDSDFTRLATRLKESEMYIVGMGEQKTPTSFVSACNVFKYLDILFAAEDKPAEVKNASKENKESKTGEAKTALDLEAIKKVLKQLASENSDEDGWVFAAKLSALLIKQFPDFDARNFGSPKFTPFIDSLALFEKKRGEENPKLIYFKLK